MFFFVIVHCYVEIMKLLEFNRYLDILQRRIFFSHYTFGSVELWSLRRVYRYILSQK